MRKLGLVLYCLLQLWLPSAHAQAPVTNFSANPTSGCGPLGVVFTDNSTNNPVFWSWDFGNGQTSSSQNPFVTYTTAGTYTVTLITRNASGSDAVRKTGYITVYPYPKASFTSNSTLACAPTNIQFNDNSTSGSGSITSYLWDFGDGTTSNQQSPAHAYSQPGYYSVSLTVQNSGGCSNKAAVGRYLRVVEGIQPNFVFNQSSTSCVAPFTGALLNQTAGPGTLTYNWTIANGATPANSTAASPTVTFPNDGTYNVTLQVSSSFGCSAQITDTLKLSDNAAIINGPTTVCVNTPATFSNGSAPPPPSFTWTFGDGTTSNATSPSKTFTAAGPSSVTLVNKYAGCTTIATAPITVINPPTPTFTATNTSSCKAPLTISFTDQSTPTPTSWLWNFGDGGTSTSQNPNHTYTTTGTFNVTLTVSNGGSCPGSTTRNALVTIQAPTVTIGGALAACMKGTGSLSVISPIANANAADGVAKYAWSAPGSNEGSSSSATPGFTYNAAGAYTLALTITTNGGCTTTASKGVLIGAPVSPAFTASVSSMCGNLPVTFTPTNQNAAYSYYWDFGDGHDTTVSVPPNPPIYPVTHSYQRPGPFPVTLTVTSNGCPNTAPPQPVTINPPIANFGFAVANCAPGAYTVNFIDSSLTAGDADTYAWSYGDGTPVVTGAGPYAPPHTYTLGPNTYPITLTITDPISGCTNPVTKNIVLAGVTPSFNINNNTPCENNSFMLTSTSTTIPATPGLIAGYTWTVGSNTFQTTTNTFSTALGTVGPSSASLMVTDINGCTYNSSPQAINVIGPTAKFTDPAIGGGCTNQFTTFVDQSTGYPGSTTTPSAPSSTVNAWIFHFGDGTTQTFTAPPFRHQYTDSGSFSVTLIVGDNAGCIATYVLPVQIDSPIANFSIPDSFFCPGAPLTFTDGSQGYSLTDTWAFGDGTGATANPHSFSTTGAYPVTLTATDRYNCTNSITKTVNIKTPIAAFADYDTTAICTPLQTIFAAHNQFSDSLYWDFGDGTTSTLDSTYHFYNTVNTFNVTLYAQGPGGCQTSVTKKIYVEDPIALTTIDYSPLKSCDSVNARFTLLPAPYTSFSLSFGDNAYDSSGNLTPVHVYHNLGAYGPALVLTDETGCIVDVSGENNITVLGATPFFSVDKRAFCDSSIVNFTDFTISDDGLTSETYNFGDGSPGDAITPGTGTFNASHDYIAPGTWLPKLTVTTTDNCTESYTDTIRVYETPHPSIATSSLLCTGLIQFNGSLTAPQVDTITWAWNFGNNQQSSLQDPAINMTPGTYTVTLNASTSFGCQGDTNTSTTIFGPPTIKGPPEVTAPVGMPVTLPMTYSADVVSYAWTPATNLDCPTCADPAATLLFSAEYYVTATDKNSCIATDSIFVKTICNSQNYFLPNTFSPNGDGVNDYFYPRGTSLYNVRSLTIFNRWGQMVFQRRDFPANAANLGWDGTFSGKPALADAYVYIVEVVCDNSQVVALHGSVTLVR